MEPSRKPALSSRSYSQGLPVMGSLRGTESQRGEKVGEVFRIGLMGDIKAFQCRGYLGPLHLMLNLQ